MSDYETILIEREGRVARVSFNRPDKLNSFNGAMRREFLRAAQEVPCPGLGRLSSAR